MKNELVAELFDGPVDIVGDIHGEIEALDALLERLGYDRDGRHRQGRRLVFVGDLVDRGPDSPAVVERVAAMHAAGRAQCVLGNHELNLLLGDAKEGNGWFFDTDHDAQADTGFTSVRASAGQRRQYLDWFAQLPLALERADLRVVHACWQPQHVALLRGARQPVAELHHEHSRRIEQELTADGSSGRRERELADYGPALRDARATVPLLAGLAHCEAVTQSGNPVKALTSGLEKVTAQPFLAGGKWRMNERVAWWHDYDDEAAVVFGHYWRRPQPGTPGHSPDARQDGPDLFHPTPPFSWLGRRSNALCIDWRVGERWRDRRHGRTNFSSRLGALRWHRDPAQREIVVDR